MCQAYEGERKWVVSQELKEIHDAWEKHKNGEKVLNEEEIKELAVRKLMLLE